MQSLFRLITFVCFGVWMMGGFGVAHAQGVALSSALTGQAVEVDYDAWNTVATRVEDAVSAARASTVAFEQLRGEMSSWRDQFLDAQDTNASRIETVTSQIDVVGIDPVDGESGAITERRAALNAQLAALRAPVIQAQEAFERADGIIGEIDLLIRDRQTQTLVELGPSPLIPALWGDTWGALTQFFDAAVAETRRAWANDLSRSSFYKSIPALVLYLAVALVLLLRGRVWMTSAVARLPATSGRTTTLLARIGATFAMGLLPIIGVYVLKEATLNTGLFGVRGVLIVDNLALIAILFLAARWLGGQVFPRDDLAVIQPRLNALARAQGRVIATSLGVSLGLVQALGSYHAYADLSDGVFAVLMFPIILISALFVFRIGHFAISRATETAGAGGERSVRDALFGLGGRALLVVSALSPLLAAVGYTNGAAGLLFPGITTLGILGVVYVLRNVGTQMYALLSRQSVEDAANALWPTLIGVAIFVTAAPFIALAWGVRSDTLAELWVRMREGFSIGETRISPTEFITFAAVFAIGYFATRLAQSGLRTSILPKTKMEIGAQNAVISGLGYVGIFLAAVIAITTAGIDLSSLAIVAGALSVGIGFGLQNIVSNFVSGIILLIERPISEGDWIEVGSHMGIVKDISVRSTRIETFDRTDVIVPNGDLVSGTVINWTHGNASGRLIVPVGVAYGTDTRRVEKLLQDIAEAHPMVVVNPAPNVYFKGFGADSLDFEIRMILRDVNWILSVKSDICHAIAEKFVEEDIEIPFAQRDLWLRNPETLAGAKDDS